MQGSGGSPEFRPSPPPLKLPSGKLVRIRPRKPNFFSDSLDWKIYRAAQVPGPGAYETAKPKIYGGGWSKYRALTEVETLQKRAVQIPGPGQYPVHAHPNEVSGGRFNTSNPKSDLDWEAHRAKGIPGPADYPAPKLPEAGGGKFNAAVSKTEVEWMIYNAKQLPGPGWYQTDGNTLPKGGRFSTAVHKTDVDWLMLRASQTPSPGDYDVCKMPKAPGGKMSTAMPKTDRDWACYRAAQTPGPGDYSPESSTLGHKVTKNSNGFSMQGRPGPATMPAPYNKTLPELGSPSWTRSPSASPPKRAATVAGTRRSPSRLRKRNARSNTPDKARLDKDSCFMTQ